MIGRRARRGTRSRAGRTAIVVGGVIASVVAAAHAAPSRGAAESGARAPEAAPSGLYFDRVGLDVRGFDPVASADIDRMAVSDPASGVAKVFEWDGGGWSQVGADIDGGYSKAMSGDGQRLVVGVAQRDGGHVGVFGWDGVRWSQLGGALEGDAADDRFGWSVAMSADGGRMIVGAPGGSADTGYVRIYDWDGADWSQVGPDLTGEEAGVGLGWSVAMTATGERVAIGEAPRFTSEFPATSVLGSVRVLDRDGTGWTQVGDAVVAVGDVALTPTGERLAVGFRGDLERGLAGRVWIFDLVGGGWVLDDVSDDRAAQSVAWSADGSRLAHSGNSLNAAIDSSPGTTVVRDDGPTGWVDIGSIGGEFWNSADDWVALSADGDRLAIGGSGYVRVYDISSTPPPPLVSPVPLVPARVLDSRAGERTVDGVSTAIGRRSAQSVTEVTLAGRGGVPVGAHGVILDVVAVRPDDRGFLTVFPCGTSAPLASSLNYEPGQTIANSAFVRIGSDGKVCIYTEAPTDLVVDVTGYTAANRSGLRPTAPDRIMDSRTGEIVTGYENWDQVDRLPAGSVTELRVTGWPTRVPYGTSAVMLDVVAVRPEANGFVTVYPCGTPRPLASSLNYAAGQIIAKAVFTRLGTADKVCFYTSATVDLVADVTGYTPDESGLASLVPARLLDSRPGERTVDGLSAGIGRRLPGTVTEIQVAGRGGVPADATAVILDVVAVRPDGGGYLTVYPCGSPRPLASNLNFADGQTIANAVFTGVGTKGEVCIHTSAGTELVVDVSGHTR